MSALDFVWMLVNFLAPALGVGVITPALGKLLMRREFAAVGWWPLIGTASIVSALVLVAGLTLFDHDGRMATYLAMTAATALAMAWLGRRSKAR